MDKNRTWCEISLPAIYANLHTIQTLIPQQTKILGIVKANGYGIGDVAISKLLVNAGVNVLATATVEEAITLRKHGIEVDILILGYTMEKDYHLLEQYHLIQSVFSYQEAQALSKFKIRTHLKIDTGMSRMGFMYQNDQKDYDSIKKSVEILPYLEGIFSHFAVSDSLSDEDVQFTHQQINLFDEVVSRLETDGHVIKYKHLQNSYGILNYPQLQYDFVRPGLILYGGRASEHEITTANVNIQPVVTWKTRVGLVKYVNEDATISYGRTYQAKINQKVATVTIGYADGYPRNFSNQFYVLIHGKKCNILGRVCMDQMLVDVSDVDVNVGDEVVLIGKSGEQEISIEAFAQAANTISNDILCRISERVERIYVEEN